MINLPANLDDFRQKAATAAARQKQESGTQGGAYLRLDKKTGEWGYGPEQTPVEPGSRWAVDPGSFVEGYIAWRDDTDPQSGILGEHMTSSFGTPVQLSDLPDVGTKRGWDKQTGFGVVCISGEDVGQVCTFTTTSHGGKAAVSSLLSAFAEQLGKSDEAVVPVVTLESSSYKHKKWGLTYVPEVEVQEFINQDQLAAKVDQKQLPGGAEQPAGQEAPAEAPPAAEPAPVQEAPAPVRRRRRRSA